MYAQQNNIHLFQVVIGNMAIKIFSYTFLLLVVMGIGIAKAGSFDQDFDRAAFYNIIKAGTVEDIDKELLVVEATSINEKVAYKGTLLMKKAGLVKKAKEKLAFFKLGRIALEGALQNNSINAEYHFLRLLIQEHAPKITKYSAQLGEDRDYLKKNYKSLTPIVQQAVIDYSKTSIVIHTADFLTL